MDRVGVLADGLVIGESPRWHDGRLWVANWGPCEVVAVTPAGDRELMARIETTVPFSIDWLPDGQLVVVSGPERVVLRQERDGSLVPYADLSRLSDHGFNEIVVDGRGNAYVNGGGFDLMAGEEPQPGIVAVVTPEGDAREVAAEIAFPNGMAVTPDNSTLIVADSYGRELTGFEIDADGGLKNRRVWADLDDGVPDGICIDAEGAVWYADVPNKRCVRVREGGEVLDTVEVDRGCFACMLGGPDGATLFICAAEWRGPERMFDGPPTGRVLTAQGSSRKAGWP
jgi:sugar lactone lactonase YvrE